MYNESKVLFLERDREGEILKEIIINIKWERERESLKDWDRNEKKKIIYSKKRRNKEEREKESS